MNIAVECYADEKLVELLVYKNEPRILHQFGKGNIFNYLHKSTTVSAIGLVDDDPGSTQPRRFRDSYIEVESKGTIRRYRHKDKNDISVIVLSPRIEEWLIKRAQDSGINLDNYSIPDDAEKLRSKPRYDKEQNYASLIKKLIELNDLEVLTVKKWLSGDTP